MIPLASDSSSARDVLLVDTNRGSYPLWSTLTANGYNVTVVGGDPEAALARLCTSYIQADYADSRVLASIVASNSYVAVIPGCTDASYLACAGLPEWVNRGMDRPDAVRGIFNKQALRDLAGRLGILQPLELSLETALQAEQVLIKPVDGFSGAGIIKLQKPSAESLRDGLAVAAKRSPTGRALIEEFVVGRLYSHSAFLCDQEVAQDFFVQEDCVDYPYAVDTSCIALDLSEDVKQQMRSSVQRLAKHLQLVDGLFHSQFLVRDSQAYLLEITRRHPGDLYGLLIQHATGFDYATRYLNGFLPEPIQPRDVQQELRPIVRHTITAGPGQDLWSLRFHVPVMIRQWVPLAVAGDNLAAAPQGRVGIVFLESETPEEHLCTYLRILNRQLYSLIN